MSELFKPWSKGFSAGPATTEAVLTAEGIPVCRMVEPSVPKAAELILMAPQLHAALSDIVKCLISGDDPTAKGEDGFSLVAKANALLKQL